MQIADPIHNDRQHINFYNDTATKQLLTMIIVVTSLRMLQDVWDWKSQAPSWLPAQKDFQKFPRWPVSQISRAEDILPTSFSRRRCFHKSPWTKEKAGCHHRVDWSLTIILSDVWSIQLWSHQRQWPRGALCNPRFLVLWAGLRKWVISHRFQSVTWQSDYRIALWARPVG